jgi:tRNA-specific 2-thiouridylase
VLGIEPVSRTVRVGPAEALDVVGLSATDLTYAGPRVECEVQLRAHGGVLPATVTPGPAGAADVELGAPARGVAPGQAVVLYDGDRVLGGGRIVATR